MDTAISTTEWATARDERTDEDFLESVDLAAPAKSSAAPKPKPALETSEPAQKAEPAQKVRRSTGTKRIVERTLALSRLERRQRELLAAMSAIRGYDDGGGAIARLVVTCLDTASRIEAVLSQLIEVAKADPLEAGVLATELAGDKAALAAAWAALSSLGAVDEACPSTTARAGLAVAKAAQGLQGPALSDLAGIIAAISD